MSGGVKSTIVDNEQIMETDCLSDRSISNVSYNSSDGSYHHIIDKYEEEDRNPNNVSRDSTHGIRKRWHDNEVNDQSLMTQNN